MTVDYDFKLIHNTQQQLTIDRPKKGSSILSCKCTDCGKMVSITVDSFLSKLFNRILKLIIAMVFCGICWLIVLESAGKYINAGPLLIFAIIITIAVLIQFGKFFGTLADEEKWAYISNPQSDSTHQIQATIKR